MERTYIVTGSAGHLGGAIMRALRERGKTARGLLSPSGNPRVAGAGICYINGDVCRPETLEPLFQGSGEFVVIHAAGVVSIAEKPPAALRRVNVEGTRNLLNLSEARKAAKFVYVSSVHAIPEAPRGSVIRETDGFSPDLVRGGYAKAKAEASQLVLDAAAHGLDAVVVHPSGILGPYDTGKNHINQLVRDYMDGKIPVGVRGGYDFVDVRDVAAGCLAAAEKGRRGECYILSGHYATIEKLLRMVSGCCGAKRVPTLPVWAAGAAAPFFEVSALARGERPLYTRYSLYTLGSNSNFSHEKATRELDYVPRSLERTVRDMTRWLMDNRCLEAQRKEWS